MRTDQPRISILINNYNYGRFLHEAIDSALNQGYQNTEVIVVDDGSTDDSREIIASYGERIIPVLKDNGGQGSTLNAGFAASRGEWILLLDSDDVFLAVKAGEVLRLAEQNPQVGLIVHNLDFCGSNGQPIDFLPPRIRELGIVDDRRRVRRGRFTANLPSTSGLCFRRDILGEILPMPEAIVVTADNYLKAIALALTPVLQVPSALAKQRIHGRNLYTATYLSEAGEGGRLRRVEIASAIGFEIIRRHPCLRRLVWRQYGHILYQLSSSRSEDARRVKAEVVQRYSVVELSPVCLFNVAGAFAKDLMKDLLRQHPKTKPYSGR